MLRNKPYAATRHYNETHMSSSPHLRALWAAALCCALPLATRAADGPCVEPCPAAPTLLAAANPLAPWARTPAHRGPGGDITYRSDQFDYTADGLMELTGNVDVHMGDREILADKLTYDRDNNNLTATGAVRYRDPIVLLQGDTGHYNEQ